MKGTRAWIPVIATVAVFAAGCGSTVSMSDSELAECVAFTEGSLGGSTNTISALALRLPETSGSSEGAISEEVEVAFDRRFSAAYGIDVDEFLSLRDDADLATRSQLGEAPRVGEHVSNEWFVERDRRLMTLWHDRYPQSARTYCELVAAETP